MRIQLLVTGDLEARCLADSIERALIASRAARGRPTPIQFMRTLKGPGFTSNRLPAVNQPQIRADVLGFATRLIGTVWPDQPRDMPELVIAIDDLEEPNFDQPGVVIDWLRRGINHAIADMRAKGSLNVMEEREVRARLRDRVHFHLLAPMIEAYFYDAAAAWGTLNIPIAPILMSTDVEDFTVTDPTYLQQLLPNAGMVLPWQYGTHHPKEYLIHLRGNNLYREMIEGRNALAALDWSIYENPDTNTQYARSLFDSIANVLNQPNPLGSWVCAPITNGAPNLLANL